MACLCVKIAPVGVPMTDDAAAAEVAWLLDPLLMIPEGAVFFNGKEGTMWEVMQHLPDDDCVQRLVPVNGHHPVWTIPKCSLINNFTLVSVPSDKCDFAKWIKHDERHMCEDCPDGW